MVFLIQNTQNRDSAAIHIKLDELIRSIEGAHNALLNLEELDQRELDGIRADYLRLAKEARGRLQENSSGTPEVCPQGLSPGVIQTDAEGGASCRKIVLRKRITRDLNRMKESLPGACLRVFRKSAL